MVGVEGFADGCANLGMADAGACCLFSEPKGFEDGVGAEAGDSAGFCGEKSEVDGWNEFCFAVDGVCWLNNEGCEGVEEKANGEDGFAFSAGAGLPKTEDGD